MKTKITIIILFLLGFGVRLMAGGEDISYVKTGSKIYFGTKIKIGLFNTRIISPDGSIALVHNQDIVAYTHNSKQFELLPIVSESNKIVGYGMMEYIATRSGLKLYRYCCYDQAISQYAYFVFKDGKLYLRIDKDNALSTLPFFGITPKI
jgi:hypothetical protein